MDVGDASSDCSRVLLGTLGHHGETHGSTDDASNGANSDDAGTGGDRESETPADDDSDIDDEDGADGLSGPGIVGSLLGLGGASYLLSRRTDRDDGVR